MDREEAALRAKIQAVRNLLAAKQHTGVPYATGYASRARSAPFAASYAPYHARNPTTHTWTRQATTQATAAPVQSANKVWVNADAVRKAPVAPKAASHTSFAQRVRSRMQLQVLRLDDGEYAKANGGFSLVRSDVIKAKAAEKAAARSTVPTTAPVARRPSLSNTSAASRAQAAVTRARAAVRTKAKTARMRTEYCRFFNKFGYCNNEIACKFLHDSRRVALCRKFARGVCDEPNCRLSHDKNKMPVCTMFLRGACTRDDCRFRHVKVSGSADVCAAFLGGYCPQGDACPLKHELPNAASKKRPRGAISSSDDGESSMKKPTLETAPSTSPTASGTSPCSSSGSPVAERPGSTTSSSSSSPSTKPALSIRPNIRFAPRHPGGALPSLLPLRKKQPTPPTTV